jgi:hypothetical protein
LFSECLEHALGEFMRRIEDERNKNHDERPLG